MKTNKEAIILGTILILFQLADAVMTMIGVQIYGTSIEANIFLRSLMMKFGHIEVLAFSKILAIVIIVRLIFLAKEHIWIKQAIGASCFFYLFAAVIPWTFILASAN